MSLRTMRRQSKLLSKVEVPQWDMFRVPTEFALDWLFDRINLHLRNQIRYTDTKHQLADMLTEGNFTRGEWNNLLLLNISHFSSACCTKNFSLTMSSYFIATSSSTASSPIASESLGMPIASEKSNSRMSVDQAHSTQRRRLKCDSRMHTLAGWWKSSGETRRRKFRRLKQSCGWILVLQRGTCCPKQYSLGETPCTRSQFFSWPGKSKEYGSDMWPLSPHIAGHVALHGSRLLHGQEDLWKTTRRSYGRFECEFGCLVNVHEYHSSTSSSYRKRLWHEFETCKELSMENNRTAFQGIGKAVQWSDRNHWF